MTHPDFAKSLPLDACRRVYELTRDSNVGAEILTVLDREHFTPPPGLKQWRDAAPNSMNTVALRWEAYATRATAIETTQREIRKIEKAASFGAAQQYDRLRELYAHVRQLEDDQRLAERVEVAA